MELSTNKAWDTIQVIRFYVGAQQYGLNILQAKEVINPLPLANMPHSPDHVEGIIELRGAFLPVIDMRKRFGVVAKTATHESKYVVAILGEDYIVLVVDRVLDVRRIALRDVEPAPELARGQGAECIVGLARWDDEIAMLLDLTRMFTKAEQAAWQGRESDQRAADPSPWS